MAHYSGVLIYVCYRLIYSMTLRLKDIRRKIMFLIQSDKDGDGTMEVDE